MADAKITISVDGAEIATDAFHAIATEADTVSPAIRRIGTESKSATDVVKDLAIGFVGLFTARAAFDFVKQIVEDASALKNLSMEVHIAVEELQILAGGMSEFGVDADTLGKGLFKLSRGIAGGDESVAHGLHMMGLSLKDVDGLNGKELFLKIEAGLATLQGGLRDTAAADLYGGRLGAAMARASEGIGGAIETWQRLNHVASTESIDSLASFEDAIKQADKSLDAMATNMIGPVAQGFNVVINAATKAGVLETFWAMMKDGVGSSGPLSKWAVGTDNLATLLDHLNQKTEASAAAAKKAAGASGEVTAALTVQGQATKFLASLEADAAVQLSAHDLVNLAHLREIGALNAANAVGIGVNAVQYAKYTANVEANTKAEAELDKAREEARKLDAASLLALTKLEEQYNVTRVKHGGTANEAEIAGIHARYDVLREELKKALTLTDAVSAQMAKDMAQDLAAVGVDWEFLRSHSQNTLDEMARNARATYNEMSRHSSQFSREAMDEQLKKTHDAEDAARGMGQAYKDGLAAAAEKAKTLAEELKRVAEEAAKAAAANRAMGGSFDITRENFAATTRGMGGNEGLVEELLKKGYSFQQALLYSKHPDWPPPANPGPRVPGFAEGGVVMVGERGPEAVRLPFGSQVFPSGSGSGELITNNFNFNMNGVLLSHSPAGKAEFATWASDAIVQAMKASGNLRGFTRR